MTYLDSSFSDILAEWPVERVLSLLAATDEGAVHTALARGVRSEADLAALLAPCAAPQLETMAQRAASLTRQRFGRVIQFYAPLYVSNHCVNGCTYCGFNCRNRVARRRLTVEDASHEVRHLADEGFRHILLVSGEDPKGVPVAYFEELARNLRPHVASLNIEIQPLSIPDYALLVQAGVDTLTLYQETYAPVEYARYHVSGPKRDFRWRLEAPERGAQAGIAFLGIGALLGLTDWRVEAFYVGLHARYLQRTYWRQHVSVSFPRMQHAAGASNRPSRSRTRIWSKSSVPFVSPCPMPAWCSRPASRPLSATTCCQLGSPACRQAPKPPPVATPRTPRPKASSTCRTTGA